MTAVFTVIPSWEVLLHMISHKVAWLSLYIVFTHILHCCCWF